MRTLFSAFQAFLSASSSACTASHPGTTVLGPVAPPGFLGLPVPQVRIAAFRFRWSFTSGEHFRFRFGTGSSGGPPAGCLGEHFRFGTSGWASTSAYHFRRYHSSRIRLLPLPVGMFRWWCSLSPATVSVASAAVAAGCRQLQGLHTSVALGVHPHSVVPFLLRWALGYCPLPFMDSELLWSGPSAGMSEGFRLPGDRFAFSGFGSASIFRFSGWILVDTHAFRPCGLRSLPVEGFRFFFPVHPLLVD